MPNRTEGYDSTAPLTTFLSLRHSLFELKVKPCILSRRGRARFGIFIDAFMAMAGEEVVDLRDLNESRMVKKVQRVDTGR